ncbi:hypothetical protein AC579_5727 [Pseudocercospora musae]|uniref:Uncharacterized protein n=1 Tax=Pseudocercospora musae TaxID=113226 RepID=A0A139IS60_9PEZI|nr:hypothetical protein AC579_5727 [Pseudocercospora musae]
MPLSNGEPERTMASLCVMATGLFQKAHYGDHPGVLHDGTIFPNSHASRPERWLEQQATGQAHPRNALALDGKFPSRCMVAFGGDGMRNYIGFQFATCKMFLFRSRAILNKIKLNPETTRHRAFDFQTKVMLRNILHIL